jgi:hypothetical protein
VIQSVWASSEVALEPWRSCSLLASALVQVVVLLKSLSGRSRSYFTTESQSVCLGIEHPCGTCDQILFPVGMLLSEIHVEVKVEGTLRLAVSQPASQPASQSVSMSWYRIPLRDLWPDIISCRNVAVWNLRSCIYWEPSLTRRRVCNLQCNHSIVWVAQNPKPCFTVSYETPPTWRARFPYLYSPGTGWSNYIPGHWVPFTSCLTTHLLPLAGLRWRYSNPSPTWRDRSLYI